MSRRSERAARDRVAARRKHRIEFAFGMRNGLTLAETRLAMARLSLRATEEVLSAPQEAAQLLLTDQSARTLKHEFPMPRERMWWLDL